jgi:hypothetical protein
MILRKLGGGDEAYNLKVTRCIYVEEAEDNATSREYRLPSIQHVT